MFCSPAGYFFLQFLCKENFQNLQAMNRTIEIYHDEQVSLDDDRDEIFDGSVSDTEESSTGSSVSTEIGFVGGLHGAVRLEEGSDEYSKIERTFVLGMGGSGKETSVVAIHRNTSSSLMGQARMETFRIFSEAVSRKRGGNANVRFAWFGGSKQEIVDVLNHGFSRCEMPRSGGSGGGLGVHLSPAMFSINSALSTEPDEDGLRYVLLCRVILGNQEAVPAGSTQIHPSSERFDSGVDDPSSPRRYVVWSACMNSHIFPNFIISFRSPSLNSSQKKQPSSVSRPKSPWMSFPILMAILSRFLDVSKMGSINKHYNEFRARKITRPQLIKRVRQVAGDELLAYVIKLHINK